MSGDAYTRGLDLAHGNGFAGADARLWAEGYERGQRAGALTGEQRAAIDRANAICEPTTATADWLTGSQQAMAEAGGERGLVAELGKAQRHVVALLGLLGVDASPAPIDIDQVLRAHGDRAGGVLPR